jgi:dUTPase
MSKVTVPILNIRYQLTLDAHALCVPDPITSNHHGLVYLKTNQNISLAYNNYLKVHTGVILISYPELILNTTPNITLETVAHCYSIPELAEEDGIEVVSPTILTSDYLSEIIVTIRNTHKEIFNAERGEPIAILELGFVPKADFILNH